MLRVVKRAGRIFSAAVMLGGALQRVSQVKRRAQQTLHREKESGSTMKKSVFIALIAALAAAAGALAAVAVYLHRREKELDEYEHLLFSEDFNDETPESKTDEAAPEAPAQGTESEE